jgi:hypothetical protein
MYVWNEPHRAAHQCGERTGDIAMTTNSPVNAVVVQGGALVGSRVVVRDERISVTGRVVDVVVSQSEVAVVVDAVVDVAGHAGVVLDVVGSNDKVVLSVDAVAVAPMGGASRVVLSRGPSINVDRIDESDEVAALGADGNPVSFVESRR